MTTFLTFVAIVATAPFLILAWMWADEWLADREETRRRAERKRTADAEWFARIAAEPTPLYDRLMCEAIEKREWSA